MEIYKKYFRFCDDFVFVNIMNEKEDVAVADSPHALMTFITILSFEQSRLYWSMQYLHHLIF